MLRLVNAEVVRPDQAKRVVAPASEAMTETERAEYLSANPDTFLRVTRAPVDPTGARTPEELAEHNYAELRRLRNIGAYESHPPALYLYRIAADEHTQTALVADVGLEAFDHNRIRPHERTRTDREDQLALHLRVVGAVASPVGMTHHHVPGLAALLDPITELDPMLDFVGNGGMHQVVWRVPDAVASSVIEVFEHEPLYITDGHHRLAAALRLRDDVERQHPGAKGPQHSVLAAIFPADQVHTLAFHRQTQTNLPTEVLVDRLRCVADVDQVESPSAAIPNEAGTFGLYHHDTAWRIRPHYIGEQLDVLWLQEHVLDQIIGIRSPRTDPRLEHVPDSVAIADVIRRAHTASAAVFLLAPTPVEAIMDSADRADVLPPKSSFFTPKPRSGIFLVSRRPEI